MTRGYALSRSLRSAVHRASSWHHGARETSSPWGPLERTDLHASPAEALRESANFASAPEPPTNQPRSSHWSSLSRGLHSSSLASSPSPHLSTGACRLQGVAIWGSSSFHSSATVDAKRDFYDVLGISKGATAGDIKKAYYQLAKKFHPDANKSDPEAEKKFQEVQQAYEVLKDDEKRAMYDQVGPDSFEQADSEGGFPGGFPGGGAGGFGFSFQDSPHFSDFFQDVFGDRTRGGSRRRTQPRVRVPVEVSLTLKEAALGCTKTISFSVPTRCNECDGTGAEKGTKPETCSQCGGAGILQRQQGIMFLQETCPKCGGAGEIIKNPCQPCRGQGVTGKRMSEEINIPAGVDEGVQLTLSIPHVSGAKGQKSPEVVIHVSVAPDRVFQRDGQDVHVEVPISYAQAVLGGSVLVPTLTGEIKMKVSPGTQPGHVSIVRGKGIKSLSRSQRPGDQHVHLQVIVPKTLSRRQEELIRQLAEEEERIAGAEAEGPTAASASA